MEQKDNRSKGMLERMFEENTPLSRFITIFGGVLAGQLITHYTLEPILLRNKYAETLSITKAEAGKYLDNDCYYNFMSEMNPENRVQIREYHLLALKECGLK
ncbi:MAG: hypothetical protein WCV90_02925 [Candidatus Woesearchaeota archaeon]|jgi:hypothetical protein